MSDAPHVRVTLDTIYSELQALRGEVAQLTQRDSSDYKWLNDHEARIRVLERVAWTALGAGLLSVTELVVRTVTR